MFSSSQAVEILGVWLAADCNMAKTIKALKVKTSTWADYMRTSNLNRYDSKLSVITTISKTWEYPLVATILTKHQCNSIMLPVYKVILTMLGTNRHILLPYMCAPVIMQGLGLPNINSKQGTSHVRMLLNHLSYQMKRLAQA